MRNLNSENVFNNFMTPYFCSEDRRYRLFKVSCCWLFNLTNWEDSLPHCIGLKLKLIPQTSKPNEIGGQHHMQQLWCALTAIFFLPELFFIRFSLLCPFMVVWGLGFWGCDLELGFYGWGFQLIGFGECGVEPSWFFGVGALYINIEE